MLTLSPRVQIFAATTVVDGRKGIDSLVAIVRDQWCDDPFSGHWFLFFSKQFDRVRVLYWDINGFALWSKRIAKGRFHLPPSREINALIQQLDATELSLLLSGTEVNSVKRQPRWAPGR